LTFGASPNAPETLTLSKLSEALIGLGFGVGVAEGVALLGVAEGEVADADGDAGGVSAGLSLLQPKRSSSEEASPRTTAALTGEEGTGEGYRLQQ